MSEGFFLVQASTGSVLALRKEAHCFQNLNPGTLNPKSQTPNPKPLNPKSCILKPFKKGPRPCSGPELHLGLPCLAACGAARELGGGGLFLGG